VVFNHTAGYTLYQYADSYPGSIFYTTLSLLTKKGKTSPPEVFFIVYERRFYFKLLGPVHCRHGFPITARAGNANPLWRGFAIER